MEVQAAANYQASLAFPQECTTASGGWSGVSGITVHAQPSVAHQIQCGEQNETIEQTVPSVRNSLEPGLGTTLSCLLMGFPLFAPLPTWDLASLQSVSLGSLLDRSSASPKLSKSLLHTASSPFYFICLPFFEL